MIGIGLIGSQGRMGRAIATLLETSGEARLVGGVDQGGDAGALAAETDVLIDFSSPAALPQSLSAAIANGKALVVGTTGLEPSHLAAIDAASTRVPILQAFNMSLGVNLLAYLVREAAGRLGPHWDIEIVEMHHRYKVDAPSGTALLLGRAAAEGRGVDLAEVSERGRDGITGARAEGAIGFASLRGGSVAGDHMVVLATDNERIELGHRAESRAIFAAGAIRAAAWLHGKPIGRYDMPDVLGLR